MNRIAFAFAVAALLASATAAAQPSAPADSANASVRGPEAYDVSTLPDDAYGRLVRYGKELTERTFAYIGPEVKDRRMRYAGNNLSCASCHELAGAKAFAMPWVGAHSVFPQYRAREDEVSTLEERVNGCMERSMAGKALPLGGREMKAFMTYMHFLSRAIPVGARVQGQGLPAFKAPDRRADTVAGARIYQEKCIACHGPEGSGVRAGAVGTATGYQFPPLWGSDSFNNGAGMNRLLVASAFVRNNMPLGTTHTQPLLSEAEAFDVAAFVLGHPRPVKANLDRDFPARWNKPVDAAFAPYVTGAPAEQHRYGPFAPLQEKMAALKDDLQREAAKRK